MSAHALSLDPHSILGVAPGATEDKIREAYLAKSKKYHPDVGGDEWAFVLVARAYESLKARSTSRPAQSWDRPGASNPRPADQAHAAGSRTSSFDDDEFQASHSGPRFGTEQPECETERPAEEAAAPGATAADLRHVNVELVWTRYEKDGAEPAASSMATDNSTLSVWMNISWPAQALVDCAASFPRSGEILHKLIDLFERLRRGSVVATRSRIEDGRFVAWLSYPNVVAAEGAFLLLRQTLQAHGLFPRLQAYDVTVPLEDHDRAG
jgi:hypothetical protein